MFSLGQFKKLALVFTLVLLAGLTFGCGPQETLEAPTEEPATEVPAAEVPATEEPAAEEPTVELLRRPVSQFLFPIIQRNSMDMALAQALKRQSVRWLCFL